MSKYTIYGGKGCTFCRSAKQLAQQLNLDYSYIDIYEDEDAYAKMKELNLRTIPQIFKDKELVGDFTTFNDSFKRGLHKL